MASPLILSLQALGGAAWLLVGIVPVLRRTVKSPAGWAFSSFALSLAGYGLLDLFYLQTTIAGVALVLLQARNAVITLGALFLLLFARWLGSHRRQVDLLLALPTLAMLYLQVIMTASVVATQWGFAPVVDPVLYVPWLLYLYSYAGVGLLYMAKGSALLKIDYPKERIRVLVIIISVLGILAAGLVATLVFSVLGEAQTAILSAFLFIPGLALLYFTVPVTPGMVSKFVRRVTAVKRDVLHAFLIYRGGSLIASRTLDSASGPDPDIFSAVLEAIQNFMKLSFPPMGGRWLDAIEHGDLKILTERGSNCFLVLVTTGREDDLLRGEMRDVLRSFEQRNTGPLTRWSGDPDALSGGEDAVNFFFDLHKVF